MSNEWTTLHTVEHKSHARGVDISVTYHLQASPDVEGNIVIRIYVDQGGELPVIPLPALAAAENYRFVPGTGGKLAYNFRPEHILCLPCEPLAYNRSGNDVYFPIMRDSIGWDDKLNAYTFCLSRGSRTYRDPSRTKGSMWSTVTCAPSIVPEIVAKNLEFIKNSIAWREACLDEFNDWCAVFEAKERQNNDNKAKAQGTIDGLADLIAKLTT